MSSASTTTSTVLSTPTAAPACANLYEIPISEAGCAVSFAGAGHEDAMKACCKSAEVISYFSDCGIYCAAVDQTIKELQDCLFGEKVAYQDVFCNAANNATATNTDPSIPATASASVIAGGSGDDKDGDDKNGDDDSDGKDDGDDGKDDGDKGSAAPRLAPEFGLSKTGLTIGALLFSAIAFGAVQI